MGKITFVRGFAEDARADAEALADQYRAQGRTVEVRTSGVDSLGFTHVGWLVYLVDESPSPRPRTSNTIDHEAFVHAVREHIVSTARAHGQIDEAEAATLTATKLIYGVGKSGIRGVCYYGTWKTGDTAQATVEISAATQENYVQLSGTTLHELGHVLAGHTAGHSAAWQDACVRLGFVKRPQAAGQTYRLALFGRSLREFTATLAARVADGTPQFGASQAGASWLTTAITAGMGRKCGAGVGTRGGTSRGVGSGSRLRKYTCESCGQILRASTDTLAATHDDDGGAFKLAA